MRRAALWGCPLDASERGPVVGLEGVDAPAAPAAVRAQCAGANGQKRLARAETRVTTARHGAGRRTQGDAVHTPPPSHEVEARAPAAEAVGHLAPGSSARLPTAFARRLLSVVAPARSRGLPHPPTLKAPCPDPPPAPPRPVRPSKAPAIAPLGAGALQSSWMRASVITRSSSSSCFIFWPVERRSSAAVSGWEATDARRLFHASAV